MNRTLSTLAVLCLVASPSDAQLVLDIPPDSVPEVWRTVEGVVVPSDTTVNAILNEASERWIVGGDGRENVRLNVLGGEFSRGRNIQANRGGEVNLVEGRLLSIRGSESRVNLAGGEVRRVILEDAHLSISGGTHREIREGGTSTIDVTGGHVESIAIGEATSLAISGGSIESVTAAKRPLDIHLSGGYVENFLHFNSANDWNHQRVRVSGGVVAENPNFGGPIEISGGHLPDPFFGWDADITVTGNHFEFDGVDVREIGVVDGDTVTLEDRVRGAVLQGAVFTGVLADGTPFSYSKWNSRGRRLALRYVDVPEAPSPQTVVLARLDRSSRARPWTQPDCWPGSALPERYDVIDGRLELNGSNVGFGLDVVDSEFLLLDAEIAGGGGQGPPQVVNSTFLMRGGVSSRMEIIGSESTVTGGRISGLFEVERGSTFISGGEFDSAELRDAQMTISGGTFSSRVTVLAGSVAIAGGTFRERIILRNDANVTVHVLSMDAESPSVVELALGDSLTYSLPPSDTIGGTLSDGRPFEISGSGIRGGSGVVTLTRVNRMGDLDVDGSWSIDDANQLCTAISQDDNETSFDLTRDGSLDVLDMQRFLALGDWRVGDTNLDRQVELQDFLNLSGSFGDSDATWSNGDLDCNGEVNLQDFLTLSRAFSAGRVASSVPEPTGVWALCVVMGFAVTRKRLMIARCCR